ncbi:hypothetical protein [Culicoidibacter larvae]|uniref:CobB/CobQ-like glutamine amidotransferase domain-containing protein n=1 Tax=Culicoidibacter larvae TaxID=2579976 RepID=A0A5R8QCC2_9FIRM|nr:hypothetical protein [Culicoidibacter larvae]TLG74175.1 hypothetical protein FEZ08_05565 [Culicoidibacter larvae]
MKKILYLCYDLLDFDGSRGDIMYLAHRLDQYGFEYEITYHQTNTAIDVRDFDFVYIGVAPIKYYPLFLRQLQEYVSGLKEFIEADGMVLAIEQGYKYLGKELVKKDGEVVPLAGIFDFNVVQMPEYTIGNALLKVTIDGFTSRINGFVNYDIDAVFDLENTPFGDIELGIGRFNGVEGMIYKNFIGTQLRGPILARNYDFTDFLIAKLQGIEMSDLPIVDSRLEIDDKRVLTEDCEAIIKSGAQAKEYNYVS